MERRKLLFKLERLPYRNKCAASRLKEQRTDMQQHATSRFLPDNQEAILDGPRVGVKDKLASIGNSIVIGRATEMRAP